MTCYGIVHVRPSLAPKVAGAWIIGVRRRSASGEDGLHSGSLTMSRRGPADEGRAMTVIQGAPACPGTRWRGQNGAVRQYSQKPIMNRARAPDSNMAEA